MIDFINKFTLQPYIPYYNIFIFIFNGSTDEK